MQPKPKPPQLVSEATRRVIDAIIAARHEGMITPGEAPDPEALTTFLRERGTTAETAAGVIGFVAWTRGEDG